MSGSIRSARFEALSEKPPVSHSRLDVGPGPRDSGVNSVGLPGHFVKALWLAEFARRKSLTGRAIEGKGRERAHHVAGGAG